MLNIHNKEQIYIIIYTPAYFPPLLHLIMQTSNRSSKRNIMAQSKPMNQPAEAMVLCTGAGMEKNESKIK